ncbi:hypothetical protein SAXI111661_15325 [Saccharomonospora xinjiangensis]|uniref:hypothetical protein n=1 Tax=Saccharomonospora xinjiangensis TaxID=75294 RepID=UPI0010705EF2|nr:hypothetical protein [Saccharomonospora xinjiangensis]QBQ61265.1 hypothetical protein EYD13_14585 [Saccharomonospora xinjiangensis]
MTALPGRIDVMRRSEIEDLGMTRGESLPLNRTTQAFRTLRQNLKYSEGLIDGGERLEQQHVTEFDVTDLYRSAWVMAVGALDHWVFEEVHHRALHLLLQPTKDKPSRLAKLELPLSLFDRVYHDGASLRDEFDRFLRETFRYRSFQSPDKIAEAFGHVFKGSRFWHAVAQQMRAETGGTVTADSIRERLSHIVQRRNQIVHQADLDPAKPGQRAAIKAEEARSVVTYLENLAAHIVMTLGPVS